MGHTIATIVLPRSYCQTYSENHRVGFCLSTGRCTGAFLKRKVPDFVSPTLWSPNSWDLNPDDYNSWSVGFMLEKVHRARIAKVNELEMRVIDEWGRIDHAVDRGCCYRDQWRRRLSAYVRGVGHTLNTKHKVSAILSC